MIDLQAYLESKLRNIISTWDEDYLYGPHYHIVIDNVHSREHIKPNDPVPEPWNSIYFGG